MDLERTEVAAVVHEDGCVANVEEAFWSWMHVLVGWNSKIHSHRHHEWLCFRVDVSLTSTGIN